MGMKLLCKITVEDGAEGELDIVDYVEREFGWLNESGIRLDSVVIDDNGASNLKE